MVEPRKTPHRAQTDGDRPATPPWVKALGIAIVIAVLAVFVVMAASGGQHGPGMHTGTGGHESGHYDVALRGEIPVS